MDPLRLSIVAHYSRMVECGVDCLVGVLLQVGVVLLPVVLRYHMGCAQWWACELRSMVPCGVLLVLLNVLHMDGLWWNVVL